MSGLLKVYLTPTHSLYSPLFRKCFTKHMHSQMCLPGREQSLSRFRNEMSFQKSIARSPFSSANWKKTCGPVADTVPFAVHGAAYCWRRRVSVKSKTRLQPIALSVSILAAYPLNGVLDEGQLNACREVAHIQMWQVIFVVLCNGGKSPSCTLNGLPVATAYISTWLMAVISVCLSKTKERMSSHS